MSVTYDLEQDELGRPRARNILDARHQAVQVPRQRKNIDHTLLVTVVFVLFLAALSALAADGVYSGWIPAWYLGISLLTLCAYWFDKADAQRSRHRTPEQTLQLMALAGGWPGALVAQQLFRHKTRKASFQLTFWGCVAVNCAALFLLAAINTKLISM